MARGPTDSRQAVAAVADAHERAYAPLLSPEAILAARTAAADTATARLPGLSPSGYPVTEAQARRMVQHDLGCTAPQFAGAMLRGLRTLSLAGVDAIPYETCRTNELAELYYLLGRSKAPNAWKTWHFYGLACDVIHPVHGWAWWPEWSTTRRAWVGGNPSWYTAVVRTLNAEGLAWGGHWASFKDTPHFQWGRCRASPSPRARELYEAGGREAVWREVRAA